MLLGKLIIFFSLSLCEAFFFLSYGAADIFFLPFV